MNRSQLILVRANKSRGGDHWSADDYDVRLGHAGGQVVGRIFLSPQDRPWFWTITARVPQQPTDRGYPESKPWLIYMGFILLFNTMKSLR